MFHLDELYKQTGKASWFLVWNRVSTLFNFPQAVYGTARRVVNVKHFPRKVDLLFFTLVKTRKSKSFHLIPHNERQSLYRTLNDVWGRKFQIQKFSISSCPFCVVLKYQHKFNRVKEIAKLFPNPRSDNSICSGCSS